MFCEYVYKIFRTTDEEDCHDLTIGLAHLRAQEPIPKETTEEELMTFISHWYDELVRAYEEGEEVFLSIATKCRKRPYRPRTTVIPPNGPDMSQKPEFAGTVQRVGDYEITYDERGYAKQALRI